MKSAMKFDSNPTEPGYVLLAMEVWLDNKCPDQAEKIFGRCQELMTQADSDFDSGMLLAAMARYYESVGKLEEAEENWLQVSKIDHPLLQDALSGLVRVQIVRAWKHLRQGLSQIEKFEANIYDATVLRLPGNHDTLMADAKTELETYRELLEKIVLEKDLWRYGVKFSEES